tara:strand:- start:486 stop:3782 length:3297 start_codon:yes stop_codon:yes gene_type:complete
MGKTIRNTSIVAIALVMVAVSSFAQKSPNIIIIYSDDHGYTDLGAYGIDKNVDTPQMNKLARNGVLFTNGYSPAPQCRPSRSGLMAGRTQNEFGFSGNHSDTGEGKGVMPRTYPVGSDMVGQPLLTIADRMKKRGYVTGFSGKWHCGPNNDNNGKYDPRGRGFDEYWVGSTVPGYANIDLEGNTIPHQKIDAFPEGIQNRVILQGKYAEAIIERNKDTKFFLYFPMFGPHVPRIDKSDPYYKNFPEQDYPHYDAKQDDVRRQGLSLLKAMDDAIGGVMQKLREHGLEENTLILFAGDNGAPSKLRTGGGTPDVKGWNGSNNVPMRGAKGGLTEGGIRVPMFAYWKGKILPGQIIDEMVTALDFTATSLAVGGGEIPSEFDGVNILPRLTGKEAAITRTQPMFWDFFESQALREGDWKLWRIQSGDRLFKISEDPSELYNVINQYPEKAAQLASKLDTWSASLPKEGRSKLKWDDSHYKGPLHGAPAGVDADPRYLIPYDNPVPTPYPAPITKPRKISGNQSQNFEIDVFADSTNQWTGKRNTIWNSWKSTNGHGFSFVKNPKKVTNSKFQLSEMKNVRIMGGYKQADKHHWLKEVKNGEPICDFTGLIEILQSELDHGVRPAIVLDQVPWALAHWKDGYAYGKDKPSPETVKYWWKNYGYCGPAKDFLVWQKYVNKFVQACVDAFGKEEVTKWMFRVGTEPNNGNHWLATWEEYQMHYDYTVDSVLDVIPNAYIGPGNFIGMWLATKEAGSSKDIWNGRKLGSVEEFLEHCANGTNYATGEVGTRITYLAFTAYTNLATANPTANALPFESCFSKARQLLDGKYKSLRKYTTDNDVIPKWFAIDVHEYGDLPSLVDAEWLWQTEWMAGMHAYVMDLAYNQYGVYKTSFWFQKGFGQFYPIARVCEMLHEMEGGTLVAVKKNTKAESEKLKHGALSAWKDGSLYVMIYNYNWDPLHQGTLKGKRDHSIDNTITLNIAGENIAKHKKWSLDHTIINEQSGNASWYYDLKEELDTHPDLTVKEGRFHARNAKEGWEGPVDKIIMSQKKYRKNGLYQKYEQLSKIGVVGKNLPVTITDGKVVYKSQPFTQSGVQLLKFTPVR